MAARVALALETSSTWLRGVGRVEEAERATRWASWQRMAAESPGLVRPLFDAVTDAAALDDDDAFLERALEGAISMVEADFGNIQLVDEDGSLRIAAQLGFDEDFLDHFARVSGDSSACGRAASSHAQTVIPDVQRDADFAPHRKIAAASGFRAVSSTPLIGAGGRLLGVVSTHYRTPRRASRQELMLADWYADRIASALLERLV
jgi:GAF domain-containing protein